jgi:hypothetical protein
VILKGATCPTKNSLAREMEGEEDTERKANFDDSDEDDEEFVCEGS